MNIYEYLMQIIIILKFIKHIVKLVLSTTAAKEPEGKYSTLFLFDGFK